MCDVIDILFPVQVVRFEYEGDDFDKIIDRIGTTPSSIYKKIWDKNDKKVPNNMALKEVCCSSYGRITFHRWFIKKAKDKELK